MSFISKCPIVRKRANPHSHSSICCVTEIPSEKEDAASFIIDCEDIMLAIMNDSPASMEQ